MHPLDTHISSTAHLFECLTAFYARGCHAAREETVRELRHTILTQMRQVVGTEEAAGGCLLLASVPPQGFMPVVTQGRIPCGTLVRKLVESPVFQGMEQGQAPVRLELDGRWVLLVPLLFSAIHSLNVELLGIVALCLPEEQFPGDERLHLLAAMGRIAAYMLHEHEYHWRVQQEQLVAERKRVACELHDNLVQPLIHMLHKLETIRRALQKRQPELILPQVRRAQEMAQALLRALRYDIDTLLPGPEDEQTLPQQIHARLREYRRNHPTIELRCKMTGIGEDLRLPAPLEKCLLSFMGEALSNVWQHAHATQALVHLRLFPNMLLLEVSDNGIGFRPEQVLGNPALSTGVPRFGLRLLREHAQELGGCWELRSAPGQGTSVRAHIPVYTDPHSPA